MKEAKEKKPQKWILPTTFHQNQELLKSVLCNKEQLCKYQTIASLKVLPISCFFCCAAGHRDNAVPCHGPWCRWRAAQCHAMCAHTDTLFLITAPPAVPVFITPSSLPLNWTLAGPFHWPIKCQPHYRGSESQITKGRECQHISILEASLLVTTNHTVLYFRFI